MRVLVTSVPFQRQMALYLREEARRGIEAARCGEIAQASHLLSQARELGAPAHLLAKVEHEIAAAKRRAEIRHLIARIEALKLEKDALDKLRQLAAEAEEKGISQNVAPFLEEKRRLLELSQRQETGGAVPPKREEIKGNLTRPPGRSAATSDAGLSPVCALGLGTLLGGAGLMALPFGLLWLLLWAASPRTAFPLLLPAVLPLTMAGLCLIAAPTLWGFAAVKWLSRSLRE